MLAHMVWWRLKHKSGVVQHGDKTIHGVCAGAAGMHSKSADGPKLQ